MRTADQLVAGAIRRGGPAVGVLAVTSVAGGVLALALPYALGRAADARSGGWLAGCVAVVGLLVVCDTFGVWAGGASGARASAWVRHRVLRHVLGVGPGLTRSVPEGDLVTRLGMNAEEVGRAPDAAITGATMLIPAVGSLVALLLIDPWLALTLVAGLTLIMLVLRAFLRVSTALAGDYQEAQADIASRLVDAVAGARTIAAAGTAAQETRRVLSALPRVRAHALELWRVRAQAGVRAAVVVPLLEVCVLGVGGYRLAAGDLTAGELYASARYVVLGAGLGSALGYVSQVARARAAARRLVRLLDECPAPHGVRRLPDGPGVLVFHDVMARGLHIPDLTIPGGSAVAVVGRSGSGKSRLACLAGRLADPARGQVLLDDVPLNRLSRTALREAIGYAFERPCLVGDTVADAIGPSAEQAAQAAGADAFIRRLPSGYATPLADAPMSGGERQRVGLARAFAHGDRLLVLDDATSSLDTITEHQVGAALAADRRTRLIVTHRAAMAARADLVVWLERGRVRGYDRHDRLWRNPDYRAVFQGEAS
ncbi:ABC transporter ATP-binding protein [Acrocarpospora phusangensis]|uniref:ABC transporter ATP-binding protein n=1 Tax=Acrocarpospora phusangensis TaxID=1070424 RepID=A0A919Q574_9ACTN|nr:ABC transporter ATP-binding protein [Acrocarpospora phusangensis]GIH22148.1 ABC transporter ATP-binding protein [Acrocarpospora phusangensis]